MSDAGHPPSRPASGILLMLCAVGCFAATDTLAKMLVTHYSTVQLLWIRNCVHVLTIVLLGWPILGKRLFAANNMRWQWQRGLLLLVCSFLAFTSLRFMQVAEFTAIMFVSPLLVTLLAARWLNERVSRARGCAIGTGFIGVMIIIRPGSGLFGAAALIPLLLAGLSAFFVILTRKYARDDDALTTLFYTGLVAALAASLAMPFVWHTPPPADWPALLALGVIAAAGHYMFVLAFRRAPASTLAPFSYAQLVFALLFGYFLFQTVPDRWSFIGMGVVVTSGLAAAILQRWEMRRASD